MRQALADPPYIAYSIAIGVLERARVDLIEDAVPPPILVPIHLKKPLQALPCDVTFVSLIGSYLIQLHQYGRETFW